MPATIYGNTSFRVWASLTATKRFVLNDLCAVPSRRQKCEGLRQRIIKVAFTMKVWTTVYTVPVSSRQGHCECDGTQ